MHKINRGHEKDQHRTSKREVAEWFANLGYNMVLIEHHCCDVVAYKNGQSSLPTILGAEIENSARNAVRNVKRGLSQGCDYVLCICPDSRVMQQVSRKLAKALPEKLWERAIVATLNSLKGEKVNELLRSREVNSAFIQE